MSVTDYLCSRYNCFLIWPVQSGKSAVGQSKETHKLEATVENVRWYVCRPDGEKFSPDSIGFYGKWVSLRLLFGFDAFVS